MTLLEKAMQRPTRKGKKAITITEEHIMLALAWASDKITYSQAHHGLFGENKGTMQAYVVMARALREAVRQGLIKPVEPTTK